MPVAVKSRFVGQLQQVLDSRS